MASRFMPNEYLIKHVTENWERSGCEDLRRAVFCEEQRIFEHSDTDCIDEIATTIAAIACVMGAPEQVIGTVRIHSSGPQLWFGSRLAVHPDFRRAASLGRELIRHAVCTAHARGCDRFLAHVQEQNVQYFKSLHWVLLDTVFLHGQLHGLMQADLAHYPPRHETQVRVVNTIRAAA